MIKSTVSLFTLIYIHASRPYCNRALHGLEGGEPFLIQSEHNGDCLLFILSLPRSAAITEAFIFSYSELSPINSFSNTASNILIQFIL